MSKFQVGQKVKVRCLDTGTRLGPGKITDVFGTRHTPLYRVALDAGYSTMRYADELEPLDPEEGKT